MSYETELRKLIASYPKGEYIIETLEVTHSKFTQRFLFTTDNQPVTASLETLEQVTFQPTNITVDYNSTKSDLDQNFSFSFSDLENKLDDNLELIPLDDTEKIQVIFRTYHSEDLTGVGELFTLEVLDITQDKGVFTANCGAAQLNWSETGIIYDYDTFPMLRAL